METLETSFGTLSGIANFMAYGDGSLKSCILNKENRIQSAAGELIPQYRAAELGQRQKKYRSSLDFYRNGAIKSAALQEAMPLATPLGTFKAELVTFYDDGSINRLFPLNGQIDGYWSEQQEGALAETLDFDLPVGKFRAKIISLAFYRSGALKSVTLWPGQRITIDTPAGAMDARTGFSLFESGALRSVEPARPIELATPIGLIKAYDEEMLGMNADQNSVQFAEDGSLRSLKTIHTGLRVRLPEAVGEMTIEPLEAASYIDVTDTRTVPMRIDFESERIVVEAARTYRFELSETRIATFERARVIRESCCGGCSEGPCDGCEGGDACCRS
ncbi:hypothetical protein [Pelagicoccus sp. SDUM812003]|uniref:hypothetical protein n=1 Tax=Pelagicoccus sp. SDUM812003 TaxID=3041267 RepID=UPI00280D075B|nr:hypothetical protein [Pelagicoccus sp. SDUM812003]MDQ8204147.1 hypothetical protein [Pelagicoccus sp. SDUM812003]